MDFWASSESDAASYAAIDKVRKAIEPALKDTLGQSRFAATKLLVRYVPIVMPPELIDRYPSRSKARVNQHILEVASQLDYQTFVRGSFLDQVRAYVDGIRTASLLPKFGLTLADVRDFEAALSKVAESCSGE